MSILVSSPTLHNLLSFPGDFSAIKAKFMKNLLQIGFINEWRTSVDSLKPQVKSKVKLRSEY